MTLTRNWDSFIALGDRPSAAKRQKADLFVSLHFNGTSSGRNEARGAETYALTPAGGSSTAGNGVVRGSSYAGNRFNSSNLLLAYQIQKSLVAKLGVTPEPNATSAALSSDAKKKLAVLAKLSGAAFDRAYVANEVNFHRTVNSALSTTLIPSSSNPELKALLETGVALFEAHQRHAEQLARQLR